MEVTDFTTDTTTELQQLKAIVAKAVTKAKGHTAKAAWLTSVLNQADVAADTGLTILEHEWTANIASSNGQPNLLIVLSRELSENALRANATSNAKLEDVFAQAVAFLAA